MNVIIMYWWMSHTASSRPQVCIGKQVEMIMYFSGILLEREKKTPFIHMSYTDVYDDVVEWMLSISIREKALGLKNRGRRREIGNNKSAFVGHLNWCLTMSDERRLKSPSTLDGVLNHWSPLPCSQFCLKIKIKLVQSSKTSRMIDCRKHPLKWSGGFSTAYGPSNLANL